MKVIAFKRTEQGTGASRRLRHANTTPGIVYGGGKEATNIKIDHNPLYHAINREAFHSTILDLEIDGVVEKVVLRDFQMHAFKQQVMHIDFQRVVADQKIAIRVPLHFINADLSPAMKVGGANISHAVNTIGISCLPKDMPEYVTVDLTTLGAGQSLHLSAVTMPAGVTATDNPKLAVATASIVK
jgi:large subunit ribosomal protein L25